MTITLSLRIKFIFETIKMEAFAGTACFPVVFRINGNELLNRLG